MNEDSSIAKKYNYDAFGNEEKPDPKDDNPFRYCGEYYDKETDTLYLRARSYDAETGRFLTMDTYTGEEEDISSLNLYTYCYNDSVNMVDPTGHWGTHKEKGKKVFTHKYMTEKAYAQVRPGVEIVRAALTITSHSLSEWQYGKILDGTLLPDFVRSGKKKSYQSVYGKGKTFNAYKKYETQKLMGYYLKMPKKKKNRYVDDETVSNIFHGKSSKDVENLKGEAKVLLAAADKGKEDQKRKSLFFGCVLHSLQDYYAHSYVSDLQEFRQDPNRNKQSQKIKAYHKDWFGFFNKEREIEKKNKGEKGKKKGKNGGLGKLKKIRKKVHRKTKDNPYSEFVKSKKGNWYWKKKNGKKKNERYYAAYNKTKKYLTDIYMIIK